MVGWHHQLDGCEFESILGVGDGHGGLACCNSWGRKELDTTERLNRTELKRFKGRFSSALESVPPPPTLFKGQLWPLSFTRGKWPKMKQCGHAKSLQ